jgi:protease I
MKKDCRVICLIHNEFEDLELWYPILRLREEGVTVHTAGEQAGATYVGKYGVPAVSDYSFKDIDCNEYDGLLVPGGWAPDKLRRYPEVLDIVRRMNKKGKPIGQICHAGWVLISADIIRGRKVTSTPGIKDDMTNAGGTWVDAPAVVDGNIVSSRKPQDLPEYMKAYLELLRKVE